MTVLVGVQCTDGVVIGADSIATSAIGRSPLIQTATDKLAIVGDRVIVAGTGSVGLGQRFIGVVGKAWETKVFQKARWDCLKGITAEAVRDFQSTGVPQTTQSGFGYGALLAAPLEDHACLVEFGLPDMQPEVKSGKLNFVSMGSGQVLADPFLAFASRVLWGESTPDVRTAMFGVYWALSHTISIAPGGVGGPIKIATLRRKKGQWAAELMEETELQEHAQHIAQIEARIGDYPKTVLEAATASPPPAPPAN
jgi:hypothetical protein